jgi:hypothetical protein
MGEEKVSEHKIQTPGSSAGLIEKLLRGPFPRSLSMGLERRQPPSLQPFFSLEQKQRNSASESRHTATATATIASDTRVDQHSRSLLSPIRPPSSRTSPLPHTQSHRRRRSPTLTCTRRLRLRPCSRVLFILSWTCTKRPSQSRERTAGMSPDHSVRSLRLPLK